MKSIQHFVKYHLGGRFFTEFDALPVETRTIEEALRRLPQIDQPDLKQSTRVYAFEFYDKETELLTIKETGEPFVRENRINPSPLHYIAAKVFTLEELKAQFPLNEILHSNIENNDQTGTPRAILCKLGNWQQFEEGDIIL